MSALEERQEIIRENLPKLVENLTGFQKNEENFKRCEEFANYIIKNHRNLSVNSHAVRKKIEGMQEKFCVANFKKVAEHLKILCENLAANKICLEHYEVDVQWSVLDFLFNLSTNPVAALEQNKYKINFEIPNESVEESFYDNDYWVDLLKNDFIPLERNYDSDNSELSDWSNSSPETLNKDESPAKEKILEKKFSQTKIITTISGKKLEPPKKQDNFTLFNAAESKSWLMSNTQNSWWLSNKSNCQIDSSYDGANFAHLWNKFLNEKSNNLIKLEQISTATEYCLLREIIWMLNFPVNCKFFTVNDDEIKVRENVTIPSVTVNGLKVFLSNSFIPFMKKQYVLRKFIRSVYDYSEILPPKSYECYAAGLKEILQPFYLRILEMENIVKEQRPLSMNTIIQLRKDLDYDLLYLEKIYEIHNYVILDYHKYSSHISSAYLLSSLLKYFRNTISVDTSNLCITLFLSSVKVFCNIIDTWWTEGRLDDWQDEFLIEKINSEEISLRPYEKSKELSFFVPTNISKMVLGDSFLKVLTDHSLEAGCTINLLYKINKINNLRNASNFKENLYELFIEDFLSSVSKFKQVAQNEAIIEIDSIADSEASGYQNHFAVKFLNECCANDEFLIKAFAANLNLNEKPKDDGDSGIYEDIQKIAKRESRCIDLLKKLNDISKIILPLEEILLKSIIRILKNRISVANNFVINMYLNEFQISKHLQNIRKVLLLESSNLLHSFYGNFFTEIESEKSWANSFALTIQLDDIMSSKFPELATLFRVEIKSSIKCQTTKVIEAVNQLSIYYNVRKELQNIITDESLLAYNKVFRFLLKVKWGLWALENLNFPRSHKNRPPYIELSLLDFHMRRLEQLRFWMIYSIQCIHFHLMTHVLHSMGEQLDKKIEKCHNLTEIKLVHKSYMMTICEHCFVTESCTDIKNGIEQLICLVYVLRVEWNNCVKEIENDSEELNTSTDENNYILSSKIESIEKAYINCHQYLAKTLNNRVYVKQNTFLSGLSAAFNTSIPY